MAAPPREGAAAAHAVVGSPRVLRPPQVLRLAVDAPDVPGLARRRPTPVARGPPLARRRVLPLGPRVTAAGRRAVVVPDARVASPVGVGGTEAPVVRRVRLGDTRPRRPAAEDANAAPAVREERPVVGVVGPPRDGLYASPRVRRLLPTVLARRRADKDVHAPDVPLRLRAEEVGECELLVTDVPRPVGPNGE